MSASLPKGWTQAPIRDLCRLINGRAFKPTDWTKSGLPIVRIQNLNDPTSRFNHFDKEVAAKFLIKHGELLFAWSGTPGTSFGAHIWNGGRAVLNQHIFRVLIDENRLDKKYFRLALNQRVTTFIEKAHGGVGLGHITKGKFEETEIPIPPLNEQRRIVAKLDALLARSRRAKEALDTTPVLLERFRQSVLAAAFRGDLTRDWRKRNPDVEPASKLLERIRAERRRRWEETELERMRAKGKVPKDGAWKTKYEVPAPADENADLPSGWVWATVDELAEETVYGTSAKTNDDPRGVPVLRMGNIRDGMLDLADLKYLPSDHPEFPELLLTPGDVLFNRTNSPELVGKTAVYDGAPGVASFASYLLRVRIVQYLPSLLSHFINSPQGRAWVASVVSQQVGQANVNGTKLRALAVPVPPLAEQEVLVRRIQEALSHARAVMRMSEEQATAVRSLEQALLAKAFRGELVPQDPDDEPASVLLERIRAEREEAEDAESADRPKRRRETRVA